MTSREEEISLVYLYRVVCRNASLILRITAASAVVALIVCLLLPNYYKAETRIFPSQDRQGNLAAQLMGQAGGLLALAAGGASPLKSPGELYVAIIKSRTVLDRIVDKFDLLKLYGKRYRQDARKRLLELINVREDRKSGIIILTVEDRDPKRAAEIANTFAEEARLLKSGLSITEAGQRRLFFEEQLGQTKVSLARAEEEIKAFQQRTGLFQIDAQARAIIEGIALLRANIAAKEVEARVLRSFATANNPDLQRVEEQIRALRGELAKSETSKGEGFDPIMSSGRVPSMGTEYIRKLRQLKYNETLYELLAKQYELAKLDEARDVAALQVIDRAVPPERKSWPKMGVFVAMAALLGFLLSTSTVLTLDIMRSTRTHRNG